MWNKENSYLEKRGYLSSEKQSLLDLRNEVIDALENLKARYREKKENRAQSINENIYEIMPEGNSASMVLPDIRIRNNVSKLE
jgi:hypothetical protein